MKLTVYNGSPRGQHSNTRILLNCFLDGFQQTGSHQYKLHYLVKLNDREQQIADFKNAEAVLLAFPLYTDCMPSLVKDFIENLKPLCGEKGLPAIFFLVQSGFPEALHSRFVQRYLERLAHRLGCRYLGCMIKGGVEGIQIMPRIMTRKLYSQMTWLGRRFGKATMLDPKLLRKLADPETLNPIYQWLYQKLLYRFSNSYWNAQLKQNNAFEHHADRPFAVDPKTDKK